MQPPMKSGNSDDFQTPAEALLPLIPYLKRDWIIWECAKGQGNLVKGLETEGFTVVGSDIKDGQDFLFYTPEKWNCIITNPPYSLKERFLERCYSLKSPFALLMPLTALESERRQKLYRTFGLQVIFLNRRINFQTPSGNGTGSWFATAWFTWGLGLDKDMTFTKSQRPAPSASAERGGMTR